ncbi:SpoIIE family protein phosphatase [Streptomyces sp. NPDC007084]|uniref:SpoIIE family protein phosphatase n=1 Tax=Streptomyces sp. NPDC007084 TaxID=3154313 RepID=UPI003451165D
MTEATDGGTEMDERAPAEAGPADPGPPGVAVVNGRGVVTAWSDSACRLLGYTAQEVVGRAVVEALSAAAATSVQERWSTGEPWSRRISVRRRDGHRIELAVQAFPVRGDAGVVQWCLVATEPVDANEGAGTDGTTADRPEVTTLKQWALEQIPLPMALFDRETRAMAVNAAMEEALRRTEGDLRGVSMRERRPGLPFEPTMGVVEAADEVLRSGEAASREMFLQVPGESHAHAWLLTLYPVKDATGRVHALSMTAMDSTEQYEARKRLDLLKEAGLRIGTTLDLRQTADELAVLCTEHFADFAAVDLVDGILQGEDTNDSVYRGEAVLRRAALRSVLAGCPEAVIRLNAPYTYTGSILERALAPGRGTPRHLDAPALRRWAEQSPQQAGGMKAAGTHSLLLVPLQARGVTLGLAILARHRSAAPFDNSDMVLAEELAARAALCLDNARRYTRERAVALALQRSLLPRRTPRQAAVEVATRYLPTESRVGIGGDWFDAIPLSGARVALVVGDVVGHGIQASAAMGRLRTAVRSLADVDLPPDELLTHLDDLVLHVGREDRPAAGDEASAWGDVGEVGATCLYAVYNPVSGRCSIARAGHPPPVLATPAGRVEVLDVPAGPPLGLGGLPFEVAEFDVEEGSVLALCTNGLIGAGKRDLDAGYALLSEALREPGQSLEATCEGAVRSLSPGAPTDDAALLLARTRVLGSDQAVAWDLPADPAIVSRAREMVTAQLAAWGLQDLSFTTELVVSELVTNAVRYGAPPVRLRLIRENDLICEVSDESSTAPRLRRARTFDEGGRGLMIVAQIAERWGCRYSERGKTIWAEQTLPS